MKLPWCIALFLVAEAALGASCCVGGSPKTFIQLRRLQNYELGISSSVRDVYGRFDPYGVRQSTDGNQTYSLAWGGGMRISDVVQAFGVLPLVYQINHYGPSTSSQALPGDSILGVTWTAVEHLFFDDWYPTVTFSVGAKLPTGRREFLRAGKRIAGSGNGLWEPFLGTGLRKDFEWLTVSFSANFNRPFGSLEGGIAEGNRWELIESLSVPINRRLSIGGGLAQSWISEKSQNGALLTDSNERSAGAFLTATYFLTPLLDLTATMDFSIPADRLSVNYSAYRALTITAKYGFY